MQVPSALSHTDSCTCHGRPQSRGVALLMPGNRTSVIHTPYDTPAEQHRAPCFLSAVSLHPTAAVYMIVDFGPRWPTLDPASLVSAILAVHSAGVDVRFLLISGHSTPADVSASLQNAHYENQRRIVIINLTVILSFLLWVLSYSLPKLQTAGHPT